MATKEVKNNQYIEAVGRRKMAIARVRIIPGGKAGYTVNDRELTNYFPVRELAQTVESAIAISGNTETFTVTAHIAGGGQTSQAEAMRHGIARALIKYDVNLRQALKGPGLLKRDARVKERKKFGLRKARRAPQWSKR